MSDEDYTQEDSDLAVEQSVIDERALVLSDEPVVVPNDLMFLGKSMAASAFFKDARRASQAIVKILIGREMGLGVGASMTGLHVFDGKVVMSAGLMASMIKRSEQYDYKVLEHGPEGCSIEFYEYGQGVGVSVFTKDDAVQARLWNKAGPWQQHPRNMLFARAMSNGAKWYCAGIFMGPVYTPEELGHEEEE